MKNLLLIIVLLISCSIQAQTYEASIKQHREHYKQEFLDDAQSPLKKEDLKFLQFYDVNPSYLVNAQFTKISDTIGFDMQTHSGKIKKYFVYGFATFTLQREERKLFIYQSEALRTKEGLEDYLFIPFTDLTNSRETFGGGRYLDFRLKDIFDNKLIIDFNKSYNPYCAYASGYSCPIPPRENHLEIRIPAGEKSFGNAVKE